MSYVFSHQESTPRPGSSIDPCRLYQYLPCENKTPHINQYITFFYSSYLYLRAKYMVESYWFLVSQ